MTMKMLGMINIQSKAQLKEFELELLRESSRLSLLGVYSDELCHLFLKRGRCVDLYTIDTNDDIPIRNYRDEIANVFSKSTLTKNQLFTKKFKKLIYSDIVPLLNTLLSEGKYPMAQRQFTIENCNQLECNSTIKKHCTLLQFPLFLEHWKNKEMRHWVIVTGIKDEDRIEIVDPFYCKLKGENMIVDVSLFKSDIIVVQ